jgi:LPXTG-motif cell wall-anchored protein
MRPPARPRSHHDCDKPHNNDNDDDDDNDRDEPVTEEVAVPLAMPKTGSGSMLYIGILLMLAALAGTMVLVRRSRVLAR